MSTTSTLKLSFAAIAAVMSIGSAVAQSSTTPTIGYYKQTFADGGLYPIVPGFVNKAEFQGEATTATVTGTTLSITQTGANWTAAQFTTQPHYIEVLAGTPANVGMILDVTVSSANGLDVSVPAGFVPGAGFQYVIRKHLTLGAYLGASSGVNEADGDGAILVDTAGTIVNATYIGAGDWVNTEDPGISLTNTVLYPGQGIIFFPAGSGRTITVGGGENSYVKAGPTQFSITAGTVALIGLVNPLVATSVSDPIYATTGKNNLNDMGIQTQLSEGDGDLAQVFSRDGMLTSTAILKVGADLLEPESSANMNAYDVFNGEAILMLPGTDRSFTLPQRH